MDRNTVQNEIALRRLFFKRLRDVRGGPEFFRKRVGDIGERVAGPAGHDELAFSKQSFGLVPLGDVAERVNADQKEEFVAFLQRLFQAQNGVDGVVGRRQSWCTLLHRGKLRGRKVDRRLQQRRNKAFFWRRRERDHREAVRKGSERLFLLVRRNVGRDEQDPPQFIPLACRLRERD